MTIHTNSLNLQHFQPFEKQRVWAISNADKIPIQSSGIRSKVNDPSTWASLDGALQYCNTHQGCFPAIILNDQSSLVFLDLDDVIELETGKIEAWAQEVVDTCNSYTERSKSGKGLHIFLRGSPPKLPLGEALRCRPQKKFWDKKGELEIYFTKKAATVTGDIIIDKPIRNVCEGEFLALYRKFFPEIQGTPETLLQTKSPSMDDEQIITLARSGKNCERFSNLYDQGEWDGGEDRSAMDLSLANSIAFYTQDLEQIKRLMVSSTLYRDKWDRSDYLDRTIETAIKGLSATYQPPKAQKTGGPVPIEITTQTTGEPFPVDCLPPILRDMAKELHRVIKAPIEMCAGAVLSAFSTATKGTVKVYEKPELDHFTCFFFMIIAESGERKSSVMKKAFAPIYIQQDENKKRYLEELQSYKALSKVLEKKQKEILNNGSVSSSEAAEQIVLIQKELESHKPSPYRYITDDFTNPALFRLLEENKGSFAVTSLDGGNVLDYIRGKGPGTDGALNDSLLLKATWGDPVSRDRTGKNEEGEHLFIKDPVCHVTITVQPERCQTFLGDSRLRGSGMIARIIPITCVSTIGTRFEEEEEPSYDLEAVNSYNSLISSIFNSDQQIEIKLSQGAVVARRGVFNEIEGEIGKGNSLEDIRDLGSKVATQVTRFAALIELCKKGAKLDGIIVSEKSWYEAEAIGRWVLDQAAHLQRTGYEELVLVVAKQISEKIQKSKLAKAPAFKRRKFQSTFRRDLVPGKGHHNFIQDVLDTLIEQKWIIEVPPMNSGSRTLSYRVNQGEV